jgi:ketopantoate hydroxymethyltransferase
MLNNRNQYIIWNLYRSAKEEEEADKLVEDAKLLERLGCFALVLEKSQHT